METIDIPTSQNINIEYQLGGIFERGAAFLLDGIIMGFASGILSLVFGFISHNQNVAMWVAMPIYLFYHLLFEVFNHGQSPGKKVLGLRVMKIDGELIDFKAYLIRYVFRLVDITLSAFSVGILMIISSPRNQRLGDKLADTCVVKVKGSRRFNIKSILNTENGEEKELNYANIGRLREEEMLVVQEVIQRNRKFKNKAHEEAVAKTAERLANVLEVPSPIHHTKFLTEVLKEYVEHTR